MTNRFSFLCVFFLATIVHAQNAHEWPQFLGPNRNGTSSETKLIDSWPTDGLEEVWRVEAGPGMSGLAISRGRLLTMVQTEGKPCEKNDGEKFVAFFVRTTARGRLR